MKFSESWLKSLFVPPLSLSTETLTEALTALGLEVDACQTIAPPFSGVVVGEILNATPHPDAQRLRVCEVSIGHPTPLTIVCGAPNARQGIKVCVATIGAVLPGDFHIKEATLRGQLSQGMLASQKELGLTETSDGILELPQEAPLGVNVRDYLHLDDSQIALSLTANRGDALSLYGIARDLAVLLDVPLVPIPQPTITTFPADPISLTVKASEAAPRYLLQKISGVNNKVPTPQWMVEHLERSNIRSISLIVDILNYVMIFLGQPMHAFDAATVKGGLLIDFASGEESVTLLNEEQHKLRPDTLVIRDDQNILACAGIMGSLASAVQLDTTDILVESAFFTPLAIMGKARAYGLHTEASHRFERGVDPTLPERALQLATALIVEYAGGRALNVQAVEAPAYLPKRAGFSFRPARIEKLLGTALPEAFIRQTLARLACDVVEDSPLTWMITPPAHRFDLKEEVDIIEELARFYGYNALPASLPQPSLQTQFSKEALRPLHSLKTLLTDLGFYEVITYSFIDATTQAHFTDAPQFLIQNPISQELASMRQSVLPSLLKTLTYNVNRQQDELQFFEIGPRFLGSQAEEEWVLSGVIFKKDYDFFKLKGLVEAIYAWARVPFKRTTATLPAAMHPGQTAFTPDGFFGKIHPSLAKTLDVPRETFAFELRLNFLAEGRFTTLEPISKFPSIERDLAFWVPRDKPAHDLIDTIAALPCSFLRHVSIFDVYEGRNAPQGQKGLAFKLKLQHQERTLVEDEVAQFIDTVIKTVQQKFAAVLRES